MNIDRVIYAKRSLEYRINKQHDEESIQLLKELLQNYYENLQVCGHEHYCCNGYYKYHNGEIYKTDKEHAEYRSLTCPICNKTISLLKTENPNWDSEIFGKKIFIVTPFQFDYKEINIDVLSSVVTNLLNECYNSKQQYCGHLEFINNGYYIYGIPVEISTRNRANCRVVTCACCGKSYFLSKTKNKYWDASILNNPVSVYHEEDEKSKQYLITMKEQ